MSFHQKNTQIEVSSVLGCSLAYILLFYSMELMEHVESLRSTLDNMSSRLGTRSRSRSASRSRSRPRSAYEK
jgi:hypothetical protein